MSPRLTFDDTSNVLAGHMESCRQFLVAHLSARMNPTNLKDVEFSEFRGSDFGASEDAMRVKSSPAWISLTVWISLAINESAFCDAILHVFQLRSHKQVIGIATMTNIAVVTDKLPGFYWTVNQFIHRTVNWLSTIRSSNTCVPIFFKRSLPQPAISTFVDSRM